MSCSEPDTDAREQEMLTLILPSMVAGRDLADTLVSRLDGNLQDAEVVVDSRRLVSASPSFAAQLVRRVLTDGHARLLRVIAPPANFVEYLEEAAARVGVRDRLVVADVHSLSV